MTKFMPEDIPATRKRLNANFEDRVQQPSWLRHANQRGAIIDHLLLRGASMEDLIARSGSKNEISVRGHLTHLQNEHQLPIIRTRDGLYMFDLWQLGTFDAWSGEDRSVGDEVVITEAMDSNDPHVVNKSSTRRTHQQHARYIDNPKVLSQQPDFTPIESAQQHWGIVIIREGSSPSASFGGPKDESTLAELNLAEVALIIAGPDPEGIRLAVETSLTVARTYDRRSDEKWQTGIPLNPDQYYVYQHCDGTEAFYVGKGKGNRAFDHVRTVIDGADINEPISRNNKDQRILALISDADGVSSDLVDRYKNQNVRSLPIQTSDYAELAAFVAEDFIISGLHGVYELTNETGGNDRFGPFSWLVRPASRLNMSAPWKKACSYFLKNRRLSSAARAEITFVNAGNMMAQEPAALKELGQLSGVEIGALKKNGQDIYVDIGIERMPFRVQLLFGAKDPKVKCNIRPARNPQGKVGRTEAKNFQAALDKVFAANSHLDWVLRMPTAADCYVKPFSEQGNGRVEPRFDVLDLEGRVPVSLPGTSSPKKLNIIEAINGIKDLFDQ
ncbi:GIY-YIG nuclease family protein [Roseovarius gahaiensis]|uniref:GIY-YIG nuclease family protein n=1 Tax=Roseovarius gahaiensis TaxID=2716691 RepID=A0A967EKK9_9RHOB|nr:GIY-YIG nuclease family protein [Roseovarius gahaiensis]NHQ74584.1 GIY-YIG nuclease family protein [Roseovarius gahaiensis]